MTNETNQSDRVYYPALRGHFGDWIYYSCVMPMRDVTKRLSFADEIHKSKKLSQWIQRQLQKGRSIEISDYLRREPQRFFNSLVVAIYRGDAAWHGFSNFRPTVRDIDLADVSDEVEDSVGFLSFTGKERIFAVDGQHRLAGMREALKSSRTLAKDQISLLLVPHRPGKKGLERSRRLFTTLNKTAKPVGKGDTIALDENDVMAIVTRFLVENDPWFSDDKIKFSQAYNVSVGSPELTTIGNLYDLLTIIFTKCMGKKKRSELRFIRPSDEGLRQYRRFAQKFFRLMARGFPPLRKCFESTPARAKLIVEKHRTPTGGHVLFRPVGLRIFTEVAAALISNGKSVAQAMKMVSRLPVELSKAPYRDVIWLTNGKMEEGGRALCRRLLMNMLGLETDQADLRHRYAKQLGLPKHKVKLPQLT
jgi:DNA sulfur modification protein DndB